MENEELDVQESENLEEEETSKNDEEEKDYKELYENQKIRAEKAEREAKKLKESKTSEVKTPKKEEATSKNEPQLSVKDSAILLENKVPTDDWDDVVEYANFKGISIREALNNSVVKSTLSEKAEERKSASAANTSGSRRGTSKISGENLLEKARKNGAIPDDDKELDALLDARYKA
jgi:hypothetical protein